MRRLQRGLQSTVRIFFHTCSVTAAVAMIFWCANAHAQIEGERTETTPDALPQTETSATNESEQWLKPEALMADFQAMEVVPVGGMYLFGKGKFPQLRWAQPLLVREVWGSVLPLHVRWFDAQGNEVTQARDEGRYAAVVEARAPHGPRGAAPGSPEATRPTVIRRGLTFYAFDLRKMMATLREQKQTSPADAISAPVPALGADGSPVLRDAYRELMREAATDQLFRSEKGAMLMASAAEWSARQADAEGEGEATDPLAHPIIAHQEHHLAIRRKLMGITDRYPPLDRPQGRDTPATTLREGSPAEAGLAPDLPDSLDTLCQQWQAQGGEPFTLVVARNGVIVYHKAFGQHEGQPVDHDTAYPIFSISKSLTGLMAAQFLDQGLLSLDTPIGEVLPAFPTDGDYVLTLRDCLMHTSGIQGQDAFGSIDNPYMDNVIANGWAFHKQHYHYSGTAMDVVGFTMAMISGQSPRRLFQQHLFQPLDMHNARITKLGYGGHLRAIDLAKLAQLLLNRGAYGHHQFFSSDTFEKLLPQPYAQLYPHLEINDKAYGLAIRFAGEKHPDAGKGDMPENATILSPNTLGHGSFSGSIWRADPDNNLVISMGRFASGPGHAAFSQQLFLTVANAVED